MVIRAAHLVCLSVLAVATLCALSVSAESVWPGFRGPNHDGKSPETGLLKEWPAGGPTLLWKAAGIGKGFSSLSTNGESIYITGHTGDKLTLFALDMGGKIKWQKEIGASGSLDHPGARSTPTLDGGNVYVLSELGDLKCFDAKSGDVKWAKKMSEFGGQASGWGYAESPLVQDNWLIVKPGGEKCIVALDKSNGSQVWASKGFAASPEYSSCVPFTFENTKYLVTGTGAGLVCVKEQTGELAWSDPFSARNTANCPSPAYADGYVFWSNGYGKGGVCMKLAPGGKASQAWTTKDLICHHGGYVIDKGYIYGDNGKGVTCLDLKTGEVKWKDPAVGKGSLCWAEGMLYLFSEKNGQGALAACSPSGLQLKGTVKVDGEGPSWAYPVVIGGKLYLRYDTTLYCFDVKAK